MANVSNIDTATHRDDKLICRFLDGEATAHELETIESRCKVDKAFADRLTTFTANDQTLRTLNAMADDSIAPGLIAKLSGKAAPEATTVTHGTNRRVFALAASIAMALGLGFMLQATDFDTDPTPRMNASLAAALESNPSRAAGWDQLADGRELRAVLTFPAADGNWCREFMLASNESHWRGVACRENDTWVTQVIGREVFLDHASGYRPAGAADSETVARFIDEQATDVALSRKQERVLLTNNWNK